MATRYWVGGAGTWNTSTTTHWSATSGGAGGASVPTSADDVVFDLHSNESSDAAFSCTVSSGATCNNLNISSAGNLTTLTGSSYILINGNLTMTGGSTQAKLNCYLSFEKTSGTQTITTNGSSVGGLKINGAGGTVQLVDNIISTASVSGAFTVTSGATFDPNGKGVTFTASQPYFIGNITFYNLTTVGFVLSNNITVTNNLTILGVSENSRCEVRSNIINVPRTITCTGASVNYSNVDFRDITIVSGTLGTNVSVGDAGRNSGITFTASSTNHWVNADGGNWNTSTNWSLNRIPLPQDDIVMDCAFNTSKTVTANIYYLGRNIDWTGATWTTALTWNISAGGTTRYIFGSLTMIAGLTLSGTMLVTFAGNGNYSIDSKGLTFACGFDIYNLTNKFSIIGNLTCLTLAVTNGTLNMGSGVITLTGNDTGTWNVDSTNGNIIAGSSTLIFTNTSTTFVEFNGGNETYNKVWFNRGTSTAENRISGNNTFGELKDTGTVAHPLKFTGGTSSTIYSLDVNGTAGNLITITSTNTTPFTIYDNTGVNTVNYCNISRSNATGQAIWDASNGTNVNGGNNTGWLFPGNYTTRVVGADYLTSLILPIFKRNYILVIEKTSYILSLIDINFIKGINYILSIVKQVFNLTYNNIGFGGKGWRFTNKHKSITNWTKKFKNPSSFTKKVKSQTIWTVKNRK